MNDIKGRSKLYTVKVLTFDGSKAGYEIYNSEALTKQTVRKITMFADSLLCIDEISKNIKNLHIDQQVPLFTIYWQRPKIIIDTQYDLDNKFNLSEEVTNLSDLIYKDIIKQYKATALLMN